MSRSILPGQVDDSGPGPEILADVAGSINSLARRLKPTERNRIEDPRVIMINKQVNAPSADRDSFHDFGVAWALPALRVMIEGHLVGEPAIGIDIGLRQLRTDALIIGRAEDHVGLGRVAAYVERIAADVVRECPLAWQLDADAIAWLRERLVNLRPQAADRTLSLAASSTAEGPDTFALFADRLRRQVHHKHRKIEPPDLDKRPEVPIDDLYTAHALRPDADFRTGYRSAISTTQFVQSLRRAVVLGTPGGGKSTLARYVCFDLTREPWSPIVRRPIPLYVTLRRWNPDVQSVLDQLYLTASTFYQVDLPEDFLEVLLGAGLVLPIFDGLDEVLDLSGRKAMVAAIDAFHNQYPLAPTLVSSRHIGYAQAKLPEEDFDVMVLSEFGSEQVEDYSRRWFTHGAKMSPAVAATTTSCFLEESRSVHDLRRNPLLLALMCILYRGHNYIPQSRPELYEECARLLFKDWDRHRGIVLKLTFEGVVDDCIEHLAHWIFGNPEREKGVPEDQLIDEAQAFLRKRLYPDAAQAREVAKEFVGYCRGRAWILSATGSAAGASNVFQFTHRTFLEHFTGTYLSRNARSAAALADVLAVHIGEAPWAVVALVAIYRQKQNNVDAPDLIITRLLDLVEAARAELWEARALEFLAACLTIVVPKPAVTSRLVWQCLEHDTTVMAADAAANAAGLSFAPVSTKLHRARPENAVSLQATVLRWLKAQIREPQGIARVTLLLGTVSRQTEHGSGVWPAVVDKCRPLLAAEAERRAGTSTEEALNLVVSDILDPTMIIGLHGVRSLFVNYRDWAGRWQPALGPQIVIDALISESPPSYVEAILASVGRAVEAGVPLREKFVIDRRGLNPQVFALWVPVWSGARVAVAVGLVLLCCVWEEIAAAAGIPGARELFANENLADMDGVKHALERRADDGWSATDGVHSLGLPSHIESLVLDWAEHRLNFVAEVVVEPDGPDST
jgi:hypothetical protein